jgi:cytosine deaminase
VIDEANLLIREACIPLDDQQVDLLIEQGRVAAVGRGLAAPPSTAVLEAGGKVLIPGLVDSHLHLDKTLMGEPWVPLPEARDLAGRIASQDQLLGHPARRPIAERAAALVGSALAFGTVALRSHVDVMPQIGLSAVEALLGVREQFAGQVEIQLVAFPQKGILQAPGTEALLDAALGMGVEVLGGIDPAGIDRDVEGHLRCLFRLATKHGVELDLHLHDPGQLGGFELERIAAWTRGEGLQGRVAVSHAYALGDLTPAERGRLLEQLAEAGITIVTNGSGVSSLPPVRELWEAGVRLAIGSDNVRDPWWPWGRGDMLERAFLVSYRNGLRTDPELRRALEAATLVGAELLGLGPVGLQPGARADFVLVDAENAPEAVAAHPPRLAVVKNGRIVSQVSASAAPI